MSQNQGKFVSPSDSEIKHATMRKPPERMQTATKVVPGTNRAKRVIDSYDDGRALPIHHHRRLFGAYPSARMNRANNGAFSVSFRAGETK